MTLTKVLQFKEFMWWLGLEFQTPFMGQNLCSFSWEPCIWESGFLCLSQDDYRLFKEKISKGKQFRGRLNDLRGLVLTCGSKNQLVNSLGLPGFQYSGTSSPLLATALGIIFTAFCIWRLVYVTKMTLLSLSMLYLPSTETIPTRTGAHVPWARNSLAHTTVLPWKE